MLKRIISTTLVVAASIGMVGFAQTASAEREKPEEHKYNICHRDNNVKKPYHDKYTSVDYNSIIKKSGHDSHEGPVATSEAVAQALKDSKEKWGDIIPPIPSEGYLGLNWTAEGQAIWNNNCQYVTPVEGTPDTSAEAICVVAEQVIKVTFTNNGTADSEVSVNATPYTVGANATVVATTPITGPEVTVTIVIDEVTETVTVTCPTGGSGGETPTTPTTPVVVNGGAGEVVSLPVTSGSSDKIAAIVTMIGAVLATIGGYVVRMRYAAQL